MSEVESALQEILPQLVELRHAIHRQPELAYGEVQTAARVCAELQGLPGMALRTGVAGTGVVATLGVDRPGLGVALRADMDALAMGERPAVPWASEVPGRMHACGHDGHVTCLVGAARVLAARADELEGPVKFIFQPAEEGGAGGRRMCEEGALEDPPVAAIFGLHGWPGLPQGTVGIRPGAFLASADRFQIDVRGQGSHAAFPHQGVDPIPMAAQVIIALQSIVARNVDPLDSAVVTVAQINGGSADNIIPPEVALRGTVRTLDPVTRDLVWKRVEALAGDTARALGGQAAVQFEAGYPVLENDPRAHDLVARVLDEVLPEMEGRHIAPVMGAEDFAYYSERIPAMFCALGVVPSERDTYPQLHQPDYDFPDAAIAHGVRLHVEVARNFWRLWPQVNGAG